MACSQIHLCCTWSLQEGAGVLHSEENSVANTPRQTSSRPSPSAVTLGRHPFQREWLDAELQERVILSKTRRPSLLWGKTYGSWVERRSQRRGRRDAKCHPPEQSTAAELATEACAGSVRECAGQQSVVNVEGLRKA